MPTIEPDDHDETTLQRRLGKPTRTMDIGGPNPRRIFDQVSIVAIVLDTGLRVVRFNRAAERLFGKKYTEVLARPCDEVLPVMADVNRDHVFQRTIALGVPGEVKEVRVADEAAGTEFFFDFVTDPILDNEGRMAGVSVIGLDVTERAQLRRRLEEQNEDLLALQHVSNALRKTMDLERALFIIASALTSAEGGSYDRAMVFLVDQHREFLQGSVCVDSIGLRDAWGIWRGLTAHEGPLQQTLESTQPVLAKRWGDLTQKLKAVRIPLTDPRSVLVHAIRTGETVTHDIMGDKTLNLAVHEALKEHFELKCFAAAPLLADHEAIGVIVADSSSRPRSFGAEQLTMLEMFASQAALAINNGMQYQSMVDRAQRDSLTRLFNHGHFQEVLRAELDRAERYGQPLSLVLMDIDFFKKFNDTYGHQTGDRVLRQTALLLGSLVRVTDVPARYGGEEFAVLLPHTEYEGALETAEKLRAGVERKAVVTGPQGERLTITASFGVSTFPHHARTAREIVSTADEALYLAKERGRNRVAGAAELPVRSGQGQRKSARKTSQDSVNTVIRRVESTPVSPPPKKRRTMKRPTKGKS
ncbi:MAG: diguanylate cyclase [Planctomycetes bacterium]|nr:diguanylate cyclase [Planctomycetota bacterium]